MKTSLRMLGTIARSAAGKPVEVIGIEPSGLEDANDELEDSAFGRRLGRAEPYYDVFQCQVRVGRALGLMSSTWRGSIPATGVRITGHHQV